MSDVMCDFSEAISTWMTIKNTGCFTLLNHVVVDFLNCNCHVVRFCLFVSYARINKKKQRSTAKKALLPGDPTAVWQTNRKSQAQKAHKDHSQFPSPGVVENPSSGPGPARARGNGARRGPATRHRTANRPTRPAGARRSSAAWGAFGARDLGPRTSRAHRPTARNREILQEFFSI